MLQALPKPPPELLESLGPDAGTVSAGSLAHWRAGSTSELTSHSINEGVLRADIRIHATVGV